MLLPLAIPFATGNTAGSIVPGSNIIAIKKNHISSCEAYRFSYHLNDRKIMIYAGNCLSILKKQGKIVNLS